MSQINRTLESPRANALLVGVGGSGKQSLSRLAAYISSMEVFQVSTASGYGFNVNCPSSLVNQLTLSIDDPEERIHDC